MKQDLTLNVVFLNNMKNAPILIIWIPFLVLPSITLKILKVPYNGNKSYEIFNYIFLLSLMLNNISE